jgi:L-threonylcarbamoyladenylate synthase
MKLVSADEQGLKTAARSILTGGVVIYPTETVYGLGALPSDPDATKRICEIKGRADKPMPLICSDIEKARKVVQFNTAAEILAKKFWPGPLTLVLPKKVDYPFWVTRHKDTLAIRVPGHEAARRLAGLSAGVIVSTSANKSGQSPVTSGKEAVQKFGNTVDIIIDGGPSLGQSPSTVLDLSSDELWIHRSGPISGDEIIKALRA